MSFAKRLSRRTVLRGVGASLALPALDCMLPVSALAAAGGTPKFPLRMAFLYVPNGMHMQDWTPGNDSNGELPPTLAVLRDYKKEMLVLTGLAQAKARPNGDGPGDHARAMASFLTGCQAKKTSGSDIRVGVSVDQAAAKKIGSSTRLPSLEIGCEQGRQSGECDSGYSCAYSNNLSWKDESTPVAKETNPRLVFERLFGNGDPAAKQRDLIRKSVLDYALDDAKSLQKQLGGNDQRKLDEYLTAVRDIETRIARTEKNNHDSLIKDVKLPYSAPSDYREHLRLMGDMLVLALQTDSTRIATFAFAHEGSNRSYKMIDVPEGHHELSHHERKPEKQAKIAKINRFHVEQLGYIIGKLRNIKEGDGTLLDHSMLAYGSCIGDGNRHNHDDLPIALFGSGNGTIKTGRHLIFPKGTPLNNLWLSMLERMGVPTETLGDSTGKLTGLES